MSGVRSFLLSMGSKKVEAVSEDPLDEQTVGGERQPKSHPEIALPFRA